MTWGQSIGWLLPLLTLGACGEEPTPKFSDARATLSAADVRAFLQVHVQRDRGLLVITEPVLGGTSVVPATATWVIECNFWGLTVAFPRSGAESGLALDIPGSVPKGGCRDLATAAGLELLDIVGEAASQGYGTRAPTVGSRTAP